MFCIIYLHGRVDILDIFMGYINVGKFTNATWMPAVSWMMLDESSFTGSPLQFHRHTNIHPQSPNTLEQNHGGKMCPSKNDGKTMIDMGVSENRGIFPKNGW